jgi:triacylglycerol lipase
MSISIPKRPKRLGRSEWLRLQAVIRCRAPARGPGASPNRTGVTGRYLRAVSVSLAMLSLAPLLAATASADPRLTVRRASLRAALHCQGRVSHARRKPALLLPGTGSNGSYLWPTGFQRQLYNERVPSCYLDLPHHNNGDMQIAAQYVVFALRKMAGRAHRPVAVYGFSQGGVQARLALTFWPSTRRLVSDVVSAAAPQHGSTTPVACGPGGCSAAGWQRLRGSRLLAGLNRGDETPGRTAWTTLRTTDDVIAQPATGPHPTSALRGASNLVIQRLCPGRRIDHLGMAFDAVAYAVLRDAMRHRGPARAARIPRRSCARQFVGSLPAYERRQELVGLGIVISTNNRAARRLRAEPPVVLHRR